MANLSLRIPDDREILASNEKSLESEITNEQNRIASFMEAIQECQQRITLNQNIIRRKKELEAKKDRGGS